jgi:O-antigen ligase
MGMKLCFLYAPLLVVGHALIDSDREVRRFFFFNSILILVVAAFGIAQSILGHTYLNPEVVQEDIRSVSTLYRVSPITGLVAYRPTSFFVSAGRFQNFLTVSWILALGFGGFLLMRKQTGRWLAFTTVGIIAAASLMTASRSVFLWALLSMIVLAPGFAWGATWSGEQRLRVMAAIRRAVVFVAIALTILVVIFPQEVRSRLAIYSETLSPYSPTSELGFRSGNYPLQNFIAAFDHPLWPYGYGLGTASLGGQYVIRIMHAPPMNVGVESGYGQLVVELGIVGLLLWILLTSAITISAWRAVKMLKGTVWFPLAFAICWYAFILIFPMCFYGLNDYQDFLMNAYFWLTLGILFRLSEFPRNLQTTQTITRTR